MLSLHLLLHLPRQPFLQPLRRPLVQPPRQPFPQLLRQPLVQPPRQPLVHLRSRPCLVCLHHPLQWPTARTARRLHNRNHRRVLRKSHQDGVPPRHWTIPTVLLPCHRPRHKIRQDGVRLPLHILPRLLPPWQVLWQGNRLMVRLRRISRVKSIRASTRWVRPSAISATNSTRANPTKANSTKAWVRSHTHHRTRADPCNRTEVPP